MSDTVKQYYRNRIKSDNHNSLLWQVGKTVNGKEVSRDQIDLIIKTITQSLQLGETDVVLDVGCGNGLITREIAPRVSTITGVELTPELFEVATGVNSGRNITYINQDILNLDASTCDRKFSKVYAYEVIQHISYCSSDNLFARLNAITTDNATIFLGGILDIEKKWEFFDSPERRCNYFTELISGNDPLGTLIFKTVCNPL